MKIYDIHRKISLFFFLFFVLCPRLYALDWKNLHERASTFSLEHALADTDSIEDLYVLALTHLYKYDISNAESTFRRILEIDPSVFEAKWGVAECLRRKRQREESEKILKEIIALHPEFAPAKITLGYANYLQKNFTKAAALAVKVIKQGREKVDTDNLARAYVLYAAAKGVISHHGGPASKFVNGIIVLPYLKKAEKMRPDLPIVLFGLGSYYLLAPSYYGKDWDKAQKYLLEAVEIDPSFSYCYARLGELYKAKGDAQKHKLYMGKALELDPQNEIALDILSQECSFVCAK